MDAAFIVIGSTGGWEEHQEWVVAVYVDEAMAAEHAARASRRAAELRAWRSPDGGTWQRQANETAVSARPMNEWDLRMDLDEDTGTTYRFEVVPLRNALVPMTAETTPGHLICAGSGRVQKRRRSEEDATLPYYPIALRRFRLLRPQQCDDCGAYPVPIDDKECLVPHADRRKGMI